MKKTSASFAFFGCASARESRMRLGELNVMIGSTELLAKLGAAPQSTDYTDVIERVWQDAKVRWTPVS